MIRHKKRGTLKPASSSIVLSLMPIMTIRNIKTPFTYLTKLGICPASANKMLNDKAVQVSMNQLTALCLHLNCTPNDLFVLRDMSLPSQHQLNNLEILNQGSPINIDESLKWKSINEVKEMLVQ